MPVYEYQCRVVAAHQFERFFQSIPKDMQNVRRYPCDDFDCRGVMDLKPSLGFYGDVERGTIGRLSREKRRYHQAAPEREAALHSSSGGLRSKKPIDRDDVSKFLERKRKEAER